MRVLFEKRVESDYLRADSFEVNLSREEKHNRKYLIADPMPNGATRFYWKCPACGRKCRYVYFQDNALSCRLCLDLTYESCQTSKKYNPLFKYFRQRNKGNRKNIIPDGWTE